MSNTKLTPNVSGNELSKSGPLSLKKKKLVNILIFNLLQCSFILILRFYFVCYDTCIILSTPYLLFENVLTPSRLSFSGMQLDFAHSSRQVPALH